MMIPSGQGEEHPRPQRLVIEPGGVLVDVSVGAQQYRHPLSETSLLGAVMKIRSISFAASSLGVGSLNLGVGTP